MFIPSYLTCSRHGVYYFRWPLLVELHPQRRASTLKVSLQTRDPREALRWSRILGNVAQALSSYGAACGMNYEEVRRLLTTHFSQLLTRQKAQIAKDGRLSQLQASALKNGLAFAQEAVQDGGPLIPGDNDSELTTRFIEKYELRLSKRFRDVSRWNILVHEAEIDKIGWVAGPLVPARRRFRYANCAH